MYCLQISELGRALSVYELGNVVGGVDHYNIRDVYSQTNQFTPTVFILPSTPRETDWNGTAGT